MIVVVNFVAPRHFGRRARPVPTAASMSDDELATTFVQAEAVKRTKRRDAKNLKNQGLQSKHTSQSSVLLSVRSATRALRPTHSLLRPDSLSATISLILPALSLSEFPNGEFGTWHWGASFHHRFAARLSGRRLKVRVAPIAEIRPRKVDDLNLQLHRKRRSSGMAVADLRYSKTKAQTRSATTRKGAPAATTATRIRAAQHARGLSTARRRRITSTTSRFSSLQSQHLYLEARFPSWPGQPDAAGKWNGQRADRRES